MTGLAATLPRELARLLAIGGTGAGLVPVRDAALAAGQGALADALALAVWQDAPFDAAAARLVAARLGTASPAGQAAAAVAAAASPAEPEPYFDRLAARRDIVRMVAYLLARHHKTPDDAGVLARLATFAPMLPAGSDTREIEAAFAGLGGVLVGPGRLVAGELALLAGRAGEAEAHLRLAATDRPNGAAAFRLAEAQLAQGGREAALGQFAAALRLRPFDRLLAARFADVAAGLDRQTVPLPGSVAVLVYCYNSPVLLARTLDALAATDWTYAQGARLVVLDNGSPGPAVAAVLAGAAARFGERLLTVRLPVNIGAPAARNWLAALPEVRASRFVAYLDDDALVPPDWLGRFGAAVAACPGAGVWGCRVRGLAAPAYVQSGDAHMLPTPREPGMLGRGFELARPWLSSPDWGQFGLARSCASVTGCCHLFAGSVLAGLGGFDLRFSPTQYDDLDHDVRLLLSGKTPYYWGHLTVLHAKATGASGHVGGAGWGQGFANQLKLHGKYDDAAIAAAADTAFAALAADCAAKEASLSGRPAAPSEGPGEPGRADGEGGRGR
ncbi:Glycosyl transferase, group 2 family protein [Desulfovibrio sp. DV]|uniref:glycosyltransferase family 2 protein n=1 Tax=Desulfovibrio sp. DV TaxID=1844708 RepID=UPI00094B79AC|nr:glycosyltransferase [Desulfovibrio sp. DV]OLN26267.1 Glycosyl transferase, group 2 family protein [Desulfovibrio sp. DV]